MRRRLPPLRGLQAFEAFARAGSMVRAADELSVTHGAISRQIKSLESQLGTRLVEGPRHHLTLTPAGARLAASLAAAFDKIAANLPGADDAQEFLLSAPGAFAMKWLIPRLPTFVEAHPDIQVRILEDDGPPDFGANRLHAAIRLHHGPPPAGQDAAAFLPQAFGAVLSASLFKAAGGDAGKILRLPRLKTETFANGWELWSQASGVPLPDAPSEQTFEHNAYMLEAASAGLGVAVSAWAYVQNDIAQSRLVAPWGFSALTRRFTYFRPRLANHPAADGFGRWLRTMGRLDAAPPPPLL